MATQLREVVQFLRALYARTPFSRRALRRLWRSTAGIFGAGSGGSGIALGLARAGVGGIRIADLDQLCLANVARHELDTSDLGRNKAEATVDRIGRINPYIQAEPYPEDLFAAGNESKLDGFFDGLDVVIGATDQTSVQLSINREAIRRGIPAVFGGCYESARGGEVLFWLPGMGMPCLECLRGGLPQPSRSGRIDYSTATGPEDYEGEPGLHAAIDLITTIEIQIALAVMLREEPSSKLAKLIDPQCNYLLIGGALADGFYRFRRAFDIHWQPLLGPRRDCGACQCPMATDADVRHVRELLNDEMRHPPDDLQPFL